MTKTIALIILVLLLLVIGLAVFFARGAYRTARQSGKGPLTAAATAFVDLIIAFF